MLHAFAVDDIKMNKSQAFTSNNHFFSSLKRVEDRLASEGKDMRKKKRGVASFSSQSRGLSDVQELSVVENGKKNNVIQNEHLDHLIEQKDSAHFPGYDRSINPPSATVTTGVSNSQNVFFSSLKQVENRLSLEDKGEERQNIPLLKHSLKSQNFSTAKDISTPEMMEEDDVKGTLCTESSLHLVEQFSSPLCIDINRPTNMVNATDSAATNQESEPPWEFISNPPDAFSDDSNLCHSVPIGLGGDGYFEKNERCEDDIKQLMDLLGLLVLPDKTDDDDDDDGCLCSGSSFHSRIVGVKGPKCGREKGRLDGWIKYYHNQNSEPARLAHLLLARAVCMCEENSNSGYGVEDMGFEGIGFPPTVQGYLKHDPPQQISS